MEYLQWYSIKHPSFLKKALMKFISFIQIPLAVLCTKGALLKGDGGCWGRRRCSLVPETRQRWKLRRRKQIKAGHHIRIRNATVLQFFNRTTAVLRASEYTSPRSRTRARASRRSPRRDAYFIEPNSHAFVTLFRRHIRYRYMTYVLYRFAMMLSSSSSLLYKYVQHLVEFHLQLQ